MTIDLAILNSLLAQHQPALAEAMRAQGVPEDALANLVVLDEASGTVLSNTGPDGTLERAHGWIRERVTGTAYRDPGEVDPLPRKSVMRNATLKVQHDERVRDMLLYLLDYYRPDLARHPRIGHALDHVVASMIEYRATLAELPDAYTRWDLIVESTIDWLEELPHERSKKVGS